MRKKSADRYLNRITLGSSSISQSRIINPTERVTIPIVVPAGRLVSSYNGIELVSQSLPSAAFQAQEKDLHHETRDVNLSAEASSRKFSSDNVFVIREVKDGRGVES